MSLTITRNVPFFNYPSVFVAREEEYLAVVREVGRRGAFIMQKDLTEFEARLASFTGAKYAIGVANATDGLHLAVRAAGIKSGDEVILCSHTMIATAAAIHFAGAIPVPVEAGADHLIDCVSVERAVTPRTRAIMPTQLNGRTCDMDRLQAIADQHGLVIVEDAAQALGSKFRGRCAGTFGVAGAISFYPAKVLGCFGDGGAVLTNDDAVYDHMCQLRDHGRSREGEIVCWGLNSRLDNLQAAILNTQFGDYPRVMERRRQMASMYQKMLESVSELVLPPAPGADTEHFDIFQNYEIEAENRDGLKAYLKDRGVGTLIQWGGTAVHQMRALGFTQSLPATDRLFNSMMMLPMNMSLEDADVEYVASAVRDFYGHA